MAQDYNRSVETQMLDSYPAARALIRAEPEFAAWKQSLKKVVIDEETFYVRGGDMLKDEDQILCEWARRHRPDLLAETGG